MGIIGYDITQIKDIATIIAAFAGVTLGLYNFLHSRKREKVNLKIIPQLVYLVQVQPRGMVHLYSKQKFTPDRPLKSIAIEVLNLSPFAVSISEVGFVISRNDHLKLIVPLSKNEERLSMPNIIEPRESQTFLLVLEKLIEQENWLKIKKAYAETSCGVFKTGVNKAMKSFLKYAKKGEIKSELLIETKFLGQDE